MSVYEKPYSACFMGQISTYSDTPEEVLALVERYGQDPDWVSIGGANYRDMPDGRTMIWRSGDKKTTMTNIRFLAARNEVQRMIKNLKEAS